MPLFGFRCPEGHVTDGLFRAGDRPGEVACEKCTAVAVFDFGVNRPARTMGNVEESGPRRVMKGSGGFSMRDYRCEGCASVWIEVVAGEEPFRGTCENCGGVGAEVLGVPVGAWSSTAFSAGGLVDRAANRIFASKGERERWMKENGYVDGNDVDADEISRKRSVKEAKEDAFMARVTKEWDEDADIRRLMAAGRIGGHDSLRPQK